uniref:Conoporin 7 n=1 Tax=Conus geographus TaxID=6491 RepID=W4VSD1_CONGE
MGVPFPALKTMVTVYLLLMGNTSPVVLGSSTTLSAVRAIASKVVTSGLSLRGDPLKDLAENSYRVTCAIEVENWTKFNLGDPKTTLSWGQYTTMPVAIEPGKREAFAVRKAAYSATGTSGTVSWEVNGNRRRFVIMWSAPYNFNFYSNLMAVGMTIEGEVKVAPYHFWYYWMLDYADSPTLKFKKKVFNSNEDPIIFRNKKFEIEGFMTKSHHALVRIIIRPITGNWNDLADVIRKGL